MDEEAPDRGCGFFRRRKGLHEYFLEERQPFHQKRKIDTKTLKIALSVVIAATLVFVLFLGGKAERVEKQEKQSELAQAATGVSSRSNLGASQSGAGSISMGGGLSLGGLAGGGRASGRGGNRQYGASQLVRPSGGGGNGFGLPMGSTVMARLVNTVISSDSTQPVIAEVTEEAIWHGSVLIPTGTRVIGGQSFDDTAQRLQIRFNTFVYPEGDQHPVSGIALLGDGSSGLTGDYHGGAVRKEVGRFLGDFVGGLASGMQDRQAAGELGITFTPGSLRNGLLSGLSTSALDEAKEASDGMKSVHPYLEVPGGSQFLLYFEKEYSP